MFKSAVIEASYIRMNRFPAAGPYETRPRARYVTSPLADETRRGYTWKIPTDDLLGHFLLGGQRNRVGNVDYDTFPGREYKNLKQFFKDHSRGLSMPVFEKNRKKLIITDRDYESSAEEGSEEGSETVNQVASEEPSYDDDEDVRSRSSQSICHIVSQDGNNSSVSNVGGNAPAPAAPGNKNKAVVPHIVSQDRNNSSTNIVGGNDPDPAAPGDENEAAVKKDADQGLDPRMALFLGFCLFGILGLISFYFIPFIPSGKKKSEQDGSTKVPVRRRSKRTNGAAGQAQNNV